jgi:hypothetical protein
VHSDQAEAHHDANAEVFPEFHDAQIVTEKKIVARHERATT